MKSFVKFVREEKEPFEYVAEVQNKYDDDLGNIYHHTEWRKFVFEVGGTYLDSSCLREIANQLDLLTTAKRQGILKEELKNPE